MVERSVKVRLSAEIGQFESSMKKASTSAEGVAKDTEAAGKAAEKVGQNFKGAVGDVDKFGNALSEADVAAGRYVNKGGRVVEANGKMAAGFGKTREATDQATDSADKATGAWGRMADTARENEQEWAAVSTAMLGIGTVAVAGVGLAVKTFADYDKAMSSVQAATHASEQDMEALGEAAVQAGADTAFSAEEAARGIEELAKAGVSTSDILGGGLDGALSLAAAGSLEVGEAAEIAASALVQFKLGGEDVEHVADLLAAGAGKAQGSVQDLGAALGQSGLVAESTGLTIEETTGALSAFASAGLTGSDAGTSFKTMLMSLNPNSEAAATAMEELGISAYDAQGNFVGMSEYAGILQGALRGMSDEQRNATMKTIFGSDAVRAANVLYEQGADGIQKWEDAVNDAGYAAETAALKQDNLAGDLEKLGGALDTVFLQSGSGANDALRGAVQSAEAVVDAIGRIPGPVLTATTAIAGVGGAALITVGGIMKGVSAAAEAKDAFDTLGVSSDKVKGKLTKLGKAAGVATVFIAGLEVAKAVSPKFDDATTGLENIAAAMTNVADSTEIVDERFREADWANGNGNGWSTTLEGINGIGDAVTRLQDMSATESFQKWNDDLFGVSNAFTSAEEDIRSTGQTLADMVSAGNVDEAAAGFANIAQQIEASGGSMEEARPLFSAYEEAITRYADTLGVSLTDQETFDAMMGDLPPKLEAAAGGAESAAEGIAAVGAEAEDTAMSLEDVIDALSTLGMITLDAQSSTGAFHEAMRGTVDVIKEINEAAADPEIADMGRILNDTATAFDVSTEAGYAAQQAFSDVAASGWEMVEANAAAGGTLESVTGDLWSTYDGLVASAQQFGFSADQAHALAREAMGIPDNVNIDTWMSDAAQRVAESTDTAVGGVDDHVGVTTSMDANARAEAERLAAAQDQIEREIVITTTQKAVWDKSAIGRAGGVQAPTGVPFVPPRAKGGRVPALADGGRLPSYATGGRLPATGLGTDQILGISSLTGQPTAWVDDREWVVNAPMSDKFNAVIGAMNRDDPSVQHLAGYAAGGRPGVREFAASAAFTYSSQSTGPVTVDASGIEAAVARGLANAQVQFTMGNRTIYGIITDAMSAAQRR